MDDLKKIRTKIDQIDDQLFDLLNDRFELAKKVKTVKAKNTLRVYDPNREEAIISRIDDYPNKEQIKTVYYTIFTLSKAIQEKKDT